MDINDYNHTEKVKKDRNYGFLCAALMLLIFFVLTALIIYLCFGELKTVFNEIFAKDGFLKILKAFFYFLGGFKKALHFTKGMTTLYYFDVFCLLASVLGFVQGVFFKKRNNM